MRVKNFLQSGFYLFVIALFFSFFSEIIFAETIDGAFSYPFYLGITGGYGSTTWEGLVPDANNQNSALTILTPTYVQEGGAVWGFFGGYEFIPYFALEGSYLRYPNAQVNFSGKSLYSFQNNGLTYLNTHTEVLALMAKIMLLVPHTLVRVYSSVGAGGVHRYDNITNLWRASPSFGVGVNYNWAPHVMLELGASYTAGYGKSELNPSQDYLPFLYSAFLRLAYRC
ncbi:MAG TPA: outer membrane beta-barrel protein [Gammaproteobacteria bacterium]|nr:outer membrane beta-barrel protein [Gammaproteobacteria bacterium]